MHLFEYSLLFAATQSITDLLCRYFNYVNYIIVLYNCCCAEEFAEFVVEQTFSLVLLLVYIVQGPASLHEHPAIKKTAASSFKVISFAAFSWA